MFWIAIAGFLPCVLMVGAVLNWLFDSDTWPLAIVGFGWQAFAAVVAFRLIGFRCPKCGKQFFNYLFWNSSGPCVHCGWPKWVEPPAEAADAAA